MRSHYRHFTVLGLLLASILPLPAQPRLSGVTLYASGADGTQGGGGNGGIWNTLGRGTRDPFNVYLFSGSVDSPTFLNGGDTDRALDPYYELTEGVHEFGFAAAQGSPLIGTSDFLGINLFFNQDLTTNRITAVVQANGTSTFASVSPHVRTWGQNGLQPASGTLEFVVDRMWVRLSQLRIKRPFVDRVGPFSTSRDGQPDIVGTFVLEVRETDAVFSDFAFVRGTPVAGSTTLNGTTVKLVTSRTEKYTATAFRDLMDTQPATVEFQFDAPVYEFFLDLQFVHPDELVRGFNLGPPTALTGSLVNRSGSITTRGSDDRGYGQLIWRGINTRKVSFVVGNYQGNTQPPAIGMVRFGFTPAPKLVLGRNPASIEWLTVEGMRYRLEHTATLDGNAWTPWSESVVGDGRRQRVLNWVDTGIPNRLFRLAMPEPSPGF